MTDSRQKYAEIARLAALLCDDLITADEIELLDRLLLDDPDAQRYYRQYVSLDVALEWSCVKPPAQPSTPAIPAPHIPGRVNGAAGVELGRNAGEAPPDAGGTNVLHSVARKDADQRQVNSARLRATPTRAGASRIASRSSALAIEVLKRILHIHGNAGLAVAVMWLVMLISTCIVAGVIVTFTVFAPGGNAPVVPQTAGGGSVAASGVKDTGSPSPTFAPRAKPASELPPALEKSLAEYRATDPVLRIEQLAKHKSTPDEAPLEPYQIFSTGKNLDRGAGDPHWEIVSDSNGPNYRPRPAIVLEPLECYIHDDRSVAQWLSNSKVPLNLPGGVRWTFRTHFDLTGFDPSTAMLVARVAADDFVAEVHLNNQGMTPPPNLSRKPTYGTPVLLEILSGFVPGDNVLEIVLENDKCPGVECNAMALYVQLAGMARRTELKPKAMWRREVNVTETVPFQQTGRRFDRSTINFLQTAY